MIKDILGDLLPIPEPTDNEELYDFHCACQCDPKDKVAGSKNTANLAR